MEFVKYQSLARIGTVEVEGILEGKCFVFPKLDGANASVWLKDGEIKGGSRNQELTLEKDGIGFLSEIRKDENVIRYLEANPTHRLYGEWLIPHSIRTYDEDAWRKFYVFDVCEENEGKLEYLTYDEYEPLLREFDLHYIPLLEVIDNPTRDELDSLVKKANFLINEKNGVGEGIVIKNYDFVNRFGRTTWAKMISAEFDEKQRQRRERRSTQARDIEIEQKIVENFFTEAFIEKEFAKFKLANDGFSSRDIPEFFGRIWHEFIQEETFNIIKKYKNPTIDFRTLNRMCIDKIKRVKREFF